MSSQPSSLRAAGQDSEISIILLPSSKMPRRLLDGGFPSMLNKQMYRDSESIESWIDAIDCASVPLFKLDDSDVSKFAMHPFRARFPYSPFSDEFEPESEVSFRSDRPAWAPEMLASSYYDDSDESRSESSLSDDAQYITIPLDSPWYRRPSTGPEPISVHDLTTTAYASSCSSDVRQAIAQQELLLAIFHQELRRVVPHDDGTEYNPNWLEDMDADLVLSPLETYADLCWESAVCEKSPARANRSVPDVPTGFDDAQGVC